MQQRESHAQFEVTTINDVKLAIDRQIVSAPILAAMDRRQYEHVEARVGGWLFDTDEIAAGQIILEIGAGLGFVGSSLNKSGKVEKIYSYEANPKIIPLLTETHRLNNVNSEIHNLILGQESSGTGSLFVPDHFWSATTHSIPKSTEYKIKKASLKNVILDIEPSFMLIDIEGGESTLFEGITNLPSVHSILIELHQGVIGRSGIKAFFEKMHSLDFVYDQRYSQGKVVLFQKLDHPVLR